MFFVVFWKNYCFQHAAVIRRLIELALLTVIGHCDLVSE